MTSKFPPRVIQQLVVASVLALAAGSVFAQSTEEDTSGTPGTMEAAKAKKASTGKTIYPEGMRKAKKPSPPALKKPTPVPPPIESAVQSSGSVQVGVGGERLKPRIIYPENAGHGVDSMAMSAVGPMARQSGRHSPGGYNPAIPSGLASPPPGPAAQPAQPSGPRDPFSPAPPPQAAVTEPMPVAPIPNNAGRIDNLASKSAPKGGAADGPTINMACTTPEIKELGQFVGKIQNKYVYKYKSQYCFDIAP